MEFRRLIDDDGVDYDKPIRLFCTVKKSGDQLCVDWEGTWEQVKGAINATLSFCKAVSYAAVCTVLDEILVTRDCSAPSKCARQKARSLIWCHLHRAARGLTGFRMGDCAFGALAMMLPDRVMASSDGGNTGISIGGYDDERNPFIFVDFACGSWGGRPWGDGVQGNSNMFANMACQSIEVIEAENPLQVRAFEFVADRAGPENFAVAFRIGANISPEREAVLQVRLIARNTGLRQHGGRLVRLPATRSI